MDKIRLGIIGLGNMGGAHANNILNGMCPETELTAAADLIEDHRNRVRGRIPDDAIYNTGEELIDSGKVDAVLIATPHYLHPVLAVRAFERGIHVVSEKPAGVYTKQVREMNEAAKKAGVVFAMMFNVRTLPLFRKMRELVKSGEFGEIRRTSWLMTDWYRSQCYYDSGSWRATWAGEGGGVLLNQCPHNLDIWQWICGMPVKVSAKMHFGKWHDIEVEDDASIYVEYANGATGTFITSTGDAVGRNRFEIILDGGSILAENGKLFVTKLAVRESEFTKTNKAPFAKPGSETYEVVPEGEYTQHCGIINAFAGAILHGTPLIADGSEGINALTISNAAHLSAWLGKEIVLPIDEELFYNELMRRVASSRYKG